MKCSLPNQALCGVAVPVSALYTKKSCGVGEFSDLIPFADFCKQAGLCIIQLLPVNDTGTDSSPYNALSALRCIRSISAWTIYPKHALSRLR